MLSEFQTAIVQHMGCDPARIDTPGVSVAGDPSRAEDHVTAGYLIGSHFFVTCDPAVESRLIAATATMEPTVEAWKTTAEAANGELLGSGIMQVLGGQGPARSASIELPEGYETRSLDSVADLPLIETFVAGSSEDDLEDADIDLDNLDEIIEAVIEAASGQIVSWSSTRPFDMAEQFSDIGILTHPEHRERGIGRAAVAAICERIRSAGSEPLYRCDPDNAGSVALSRSLGFEVATQLTAFRFPVG